MNAKIAAQRLHNQGTIARSRRKPMDVVAWLGAVQAQEYQPAKWALALRMPEGTTDAEIEQAFENGQILRTHVMRPTWHFVTPSDIRWMLELTAPRVHRMVAYYKRDQNLDAAMLSRGIAVFERALRDGRYLTRAELANELARAGLAANGLRLGLLVMHAELEGVICSGPRRGKQFTYALLAERAPRARRLSRDEALAELTERFFKSHGPATIRDFAWWSGLTTADAKRGLGMNNARQASVDGLTYWTLGRSPAPDTRPKTVHLLPVYDEYLVAYRDRHAVPHGPSTLHAGARAVTFQHAVVIAGQIAGTWRTARNSHGLVVDVTPLRRLVATERRGLADAAAHYEAFLGVPVSLSIA
jgi:hypothetical protein